MLKQAKTVVKGILAFDLFWVSSHWAQQHTTFYQVKVWSENAKRVYVCDVPSSGNLASGSHCRTDYYASAPNAAFITKFDDPSMDNLGNRSQARLRVNPHHECEGAICECKRLSLQEPLSFMGVLWSKSLILNFLPRDQ